MCKCNMHWIITIKKTLIQPLYGKKSLVRVFGVRLPRTEALGGETTGASPGQQEHWEPLQKSPLVELDEIHTTSQH